MQRKRRDNETQYEIEPAEQTWVLMVRHGSRPFSPPTDIIELADRILVVSELAGVRSSDLEITLAERALIISGKREKARHENPAYHQVEIMYGEFRIEVDLPWPVEQDGVTATYEAGLLQVELPRKSAKSIRVVEVMDAE